MADKKAQLQAVLAILAFVVIGIISLVFFAGWKYGINLVTEKIVDTQLPSNIVNVSQAAQNTFSYMNTGLDQLKLAAFFIMFGYFFAVMLIAYFAGDHPIWIAVFFVFSIFIFILSVYIANTYNNMLSSPILGDILTSYGASNFIMRHLPKFTVFAVFSGIIIMAVGAAKRSSI